ncbi:hypothetical protein GCM10027445_23470 [Amycolatopsis endophytica]
MFAGLNACQVLDQLVAGQGFNPGENKTNDAVANTSVNGRQAMKADIPLGGCAIAVEVGEHARAMVQVALATGPRDPQACVDAQAFAEKLEPLLPR